MIQIKQICKSVVTITGLMLLFNLTMVSAEEAKQRVSFAISGGASKGAYEAGLNWAVMMAMRYEAEKQDTVLRGKYRPFEAASMTGASAGAINALLSAIAWCMLPEEISNLPNRVDDNIFRNLWLAPDINNLLPPSASSPIYRQDDAVLARKSLIEAADKLREIWSLPIFRKGCRIPLGVTVTRVFPEQLKVGDINVKNQRFSIPFELRVQDDATVGFYFDPQDYPALLDYSMILLPNQRGEKKHKIDDKRIVDVVLTSAAFPVAFGRKRLQNCRIKARYQSTEENGIAATEKDENEGLVCPEGYELSEAEFADGGLFDNLPIGLGRTLAEEHVRSNENSLPVTYIYFDPNRLRYQLPEKRKFEACFSDEPPEACNEMEYSFASESHLLFGAFGTAQSYELYRELTGDAWSGNLSVLSYTIAELLEGMDAQAGCANELPYFEGDFPCASALRFTGRLLEISYDRVDSPITAPFSINKLKNAGLVSRCKKVKIDGDVPVEAECYIDYEKFRQKLADRLTAVLDLLPDHNAILDRQVHNARFSIYNDRIIRVTSRGYPITGELLEAFAAFLELKFREFDYYVGVFDAVIQMTNVVCNHHYSRRRQQSEFQACQDALAKQFYHGLGLGDDEKGRYVFALLSKWEFGSQQVFQFAYDPMPKEDRDMRIIYEALKDVLSSELHTTTDMVETSTAEFRFFSYLKEHGFEPTPAEDGSAPLLASIMEDPDFWPHELTARFTERLVDLEQDANRIFEEREPDPEKRPDTNSGLLGGASYILRSATYKYEPFNFSPSTAPRGWFWRNLIPYELAFDFSEGDIQMVWQPTWLVAKDNLLGVRGTIAVAEGILGSESSKTRDNYFSLGLNYSHLTNFGVISGIGFTPTYFQTFRTQENGGNDSFGGDVHISLLKNKIRLALGTRDFDNASDNWYLLFGLTDIPGIVYWFTR